MRPKTLNFGRMSQKRLDQLKDSPKGLSRSVAVILNKGNDLKIEKVELEKSLFKASTKPVKPGLMTKIKVEKAQEGCKPRPFEDLYKSEGP
ncbi:MAG: hypothetical protein JRF64_11680 [Deltaproteobacteria bacterium]|nr:hypothetical protein [Deltaproteobacteria bacterium]